MATTLVALRVHRGERAVFRSLLVCVVSSPGSWLAAPRYAFASRFEVEGRRAPPRRRRIEQLDTRRGSRRIVSRVSSWTPESRVDPCLASRGFHLAGRHTGAAGRRPTDVCNPLIRFSKSQKTRTLDQRSRPPRPGRGDGWFAFVRCLPQCRCRSVHGCVRLVRCVRPVVVARTALASGSLSRP